MPDHKKKFWLENPFSLFSNMEKIVPLKSMCLSDQMNSLTRITIFIALILFLVKPTSSIIFLIVSLLFIIIVYYIQKKPFNLLLRLIKFIWMIIQIIIILFYCLMVQKNRPPLNIYLLFLKLKLRSLLGMQKYPFLY